MTGKLTAELCFCSNVDAIPASAPLPSPADDHTCLSGLDLKMTLHYPVRAFSFDDVDTRPHLPD